MDMLEWTNLLPIGALFILLYGSHRVSYNQEYLSLPVSKYVKGWAACLVVLHHLAQHTDSGDLFRPFINVGYLAVAIFFFFSAFGLQKRHMEDPMYAKYFLQMRLPMFYVPYLVAVATFILLQFCRAEYIPPLWRFVIPSYENHATAYPYAWFIFCILGFYIWYWGCMIICKHNYKAILIGIFIYCWVWIAFAAKEGVAEISSMTAIPLGMIWAWKEKVFTRLLKEKYMYVLCVTLLGIYGMILTSYFYSLSVPVARNIKTILWLFLLFLFLARWQVKNRILSFLGKFYFEVYLMQGVMLVLVFGRDSINADSWVEFIRCLKVLIGSGVFAYLLHKIYARPLQEYRKKIETIISKYGF